MTTKTEHTTDVLIDGKVYTISGEEDAERVQKVAQLVNDTIQEVRMIPGYRRLEESYQALLLNLNLADACYREHAELLRQQTELEEREHELYAVKHDMVSLRMKLEAALKQQEKLGERIEEWKNRYEALKERSGAKHHDAN